MRLTREVRQKVLSEHEGFRIEEVFDGKNYKQVNSYQIKKGRLQITSKGKSCWSNRKIIKKHVASKEEERKFIKKHLLDDESITND